MRRTLPAQRQARGSAMLALLVIIVICGALAASVILPNIAREREAAMLLRRERAFQLAEAGIDWGLAAIRERNGALPLLAEEQRTIGSVGQFVVRYSDGTTNALDDDGDAMVDEADEADYMILSATGTSGDARRTLEVLLRRSLEVPPVSASVQFNVTNPIIDLNGNAFTISGDDHEVDGDLDGSGSSRAGIASPATVADIESQIPVARHDQIEGSGGAPSIQQVAAIDLTKLVTQARAAATVSIPPGTHSGQTIGEPTAEGVVVAYCEGDLHLSGGTSGAGVLVVDGDLHVSGGFTWTGLLVVRGRVTMTGGGSTKRLVGGMVIGEEISSTASESEVTIGGTVDLLYSSGAIEMASQGLVVMSVMVWAETANP